VHSDGISAGDVLAEVVTAEGGAGSVVEAACGDAVMLGVDGVDLPAVAVAHRVGRLVDVGGVEDSDGGVVAAADDQIVDGAGHQGWARISARAACSWA
jgi:hypothetical protein